MKHIGLEIRRRIQSFKGMNLPFLSFALFFEIEDGDAAAAVAGIDDVGCFRVQVKRDVSASDSLLKRGDNLLLFMLNCTQSLKKLDLANKHAISLYRIVYSMSKITLS
jgi:hypothetical protein